MREVMEDRSFGELVGELNDQVRTLISQEVRLAKAEVSEKGKQAGKGVGFIAAGGFVAYAGFLAILAGIIVGLGHLVPMWVAALLVGLIVALVGYLVVQKGISSLKPENLKPENTAKSIKENKEWLQSQAR